MAAPTAPPTRPPAAPSTAGIICGNSDAISPKSSGANGSAFGSSWPGWSTSPLTVVGSVAVSSPLGSSPAVTVSVFS